LDAVGGERRLLLQWVPHAYGKRSLNLRFCRWVRRRAKAGDALDIMIHEPGLAFREGTVRQDVAAAVHRLMLTTLLREARRVWVAIPAWADVLRPWAIGRDDLPVAWLPVPSTLPVVHDPEAVRRVRARLAPAGDLIVGHFSTYQAAIHQALCDLTPRLLGAALKGCATGASPHDAAGEPVAQPFRAASSRVHIHLVGRGSDAVARQLQTTAGEDADRISASGDLDPASLSIALQACDLLMQPYPDGASSRRTTLMAALAHGLPVVTTTGRLSESFWQDSKAVAIAPASDAAALARATIGLLRDEEHRCQMSAAARDLYQQRFSIDHVIRALRSEAYEAVC
jgi:glycosyltransferase involved in cell wall biosynthesis